MKVALMDTNDSTGSLCLRVSADILRHPEELPFVLRNIVVVLSGQIRRGNDRALDEAFDEYMKVLYSLELAFRSLID